MMQHELHNLSIPKGMRPGRRELNEASVEISYSDAMPSHMKNGTREVRRLSVPPEHRRKKMGTALMNFVCQEADANAIVLLLIAAAFGDDPGPEDAQLVEWYKLFGFKAIQVTPLGTLMARQPQAPPSNAIARATKLALVN